MRSRIIAAGRRYAPTVMLGQAIIVIIASLFLKWFSQVVAIDLIYTNDCGTLRGYYTLYCRVIIYGYHTHIGPIQTIICIGLVINAIVALRKISKKRIILAMSGYLLHAIYWWVTTLLIYEYVIKPQIYENGIFLFLYGTTSYTITYPLWIYQLTTKQKAKSPPVQNDTKP